MDWHSSTGSTGLSYHRSSCHTAQALVQVTTASHPARQCIANLKAVISAVKGTWVTGINPDGVEALYDLMCKLENHFREIAPHEHWHTQIFDVLQECALPKEISVPTTPRESAVAFLDGQIPVQDSHKPSTSPIVFENVLKIADIERHTLPADLVKFLETQSAQAYSDTTMNEHIYNFEDLLEGIEGGGYVVSEEVKHALEQIADACTKAECGYFRVVFW